MIRNRTRQRSREPLGEQIGMIPQFHAGQSNALDTVSPMGSRVSAQSIQPRNQNPPMTTTEKEIFANLVFAARRTLNALNHPLTEPAACLPIDEIRQDMENALSDVASLSR